MAAQIICYPVVFLIGVALGTRFSQMMSERQATTAFGWFLVAAAIMMDVLELLS